MLQVLSQVAVGPIVFAHQGGWDETLMVLTPIAVFAFLLKVANGRARQAQEAAQAAGQESGPESGPTSGPTSGQEPPSASGTDDQRG